MGLAQMKQETQPNKVVDAARSAQMARIRNRDTKPELRVRRALHSFGLRYGLHAKGLPGRPDLVLAARRAIVFVHGCFWHQHQDPSCKLARVPKSRFEFWGPKFEGNRLRDLRVKSALEAKGWQVFEVWECQTSPEQLKRLAVRLKAIPKSRSLVKRSRGANESRI